MVFCLDRCQVMLWYESTYTDIFVFIIDRETISQNKKKELQYKIRHLNIIFGGSRVFSNHKVDRF